MTQEAKDCMLSLRKGGSPEPNDGMSLSSLLGVERVSSTHRTNAAGRVDKRVRCKGTTPWYTRDLWSLSDH